MKPLLILTIFLSILTHMVSGQSRGVWFWGSTTLPGGGASPWGSNDVVGDAALEDDTVGFLTAHYVDRIFGSYGNRPVSEAAVIAAWNEKLFLNGISSQLLLSGSAVNDPVEVANWQSKITNRLINFNNTGSFTPSQKFKALHLDLEPQQLAAWGAGDGDVKKALLNDLLNVYTLIRSQLDTAGYSSLPIYADIPFFWDKLPVDGGSVNWLTAAERDAWFASVASVLEGVSVMTFSKDNSSALQVATDYERTGPLYGKAVIAIQPKVGVAELWADYPEFECVLHQLEDEVMPNQATDIENYAFWRHATDTLPLTEIHRGVWFWGSTTLPGGGSSPYGSIDVVGDAPAEDETVTFFTNHGVKRVYGSYQNRPVSEPSVIAAWNAKLDAACVSSQLLLDGNAVNDTAFMTSLLNKVTTRLINFNSSVADDAEKFDALHLDLEPQGLALWDGGTPAVKRALLDDLLTAYLDVRAHLDTAGFTEMPIYADIPFFWDKLPVDGGSVGWLTAFDRDTWFSDVAAVLDGVSIMTFSKDNFASLDAAIDYERTTGMPGEARVGIQPKVGPSELWLNIGEFNTVMLEAEAVYGHTGATDIENYGFWRHAIATTGILPAITGVVEVAPDPNTGGGVVIIHGVPGHLYIVRQSSNLGRWDELTRVRMQVAGDARIPFKTDRASKFFQVEIVADR